MIVGIFKLTRPLNALLAGVAVWLGFHLGGATANVLLIVFGALSASLVAAFANIDNDIADVAIDRVNRPARPLPSGQVGMRAAFVSSATVLAAGLVAAGLCGNTALEVAGGVAVLLLIYNRWGKRWFLAGNLMISLTGAMPIVYAGAILTPQPGRWKYLGVAYALGAAFHLVREMLKDIQDIEGDQRGGAKTLPVVLGPRLTARLAGSLLVVFSILALAPAVVRWVPETYAYALAILIILPALAGGYRLWRNPTPEEAGKWSLAAKGMMVIGLVLLWWGVP